MQETMWLQDQNSFEVPQKFQKWLHTKVTKEWLTSVVTCGSDLVPTRTPRCSENTAPSAKMYSLRASQVDNSLAEASAFIIPNAVLITIVTSAMILETSGICARAHPPRSVDDRGEHWQSLAERRHCFAVVSIPLVLRWILSLDILLTMMPK